MRVVKLKKLASEWNMNSAKNFENTESYLEYAIGEINKNAGTLEFHQFLYLIDTLYAVLRPKEKEVESKRDTTVIRFDPVNETKRHYEGVYDEERLQETAIADSEVAKEGIAQLEKMREEMEGIGREMAEDEEIPEASTNFGTKLPWE